NFNTPSCDEISFEQEKAMYLAGLNQLKGYEFVDTNNIFILGHDLGGLMAPVIANHPETDIKGVMVYGTFLESWVEYLLQLARFQTPKLGRDYVKSSAEYKELFKISFELFENGKSPAVLANENESYKATLQSTFGWDGADGILGRNFKFWYDIQALNMVSEWAKCESYVQVLAGNVDLKTPDLNQQKEIVKIVNTYHPDKAKFMLAENTNHIFLKLESEKEGIEAMKDPEKMFGLYQSNFNFTLVEKMGDWILETAEK
ncbi:MAG: hypothetical protein MRZ79_25615, partial [Bacteroidia bacterium]|nr:hypothetical protein [Bacteroidia bacterium]